MEKLSERLRRIRQLKGMTQREVSKQLNITSSAYSNYEQGIRAPDVETCKQLAKILNISLIYLLQGEESNVMSLTLDKNVVKIPVYGVIPAGIPVEAIEEVLDYEEIPQKLAQTGEFFALKVQGNSMYPEIKDKDIVIIRKQDDAVNGDICAVLVNGYDATLKKIKKEESGLSLIPYNPEHETKFYSKEECGTLPVKIIGKVVEIRRTL